MNDDRPTGQDFKAQQKERARLARKAAYEKQKAYIKEKRDAMKSDPEYKKQRQERRDEQRERYKRLKDKHPTAERTASADAALQAEEKRTKERKVKDRVLLETLKSGSDLNGSTPELDRPAITKPFLRLIRSED